MHNLSEIPFALSDVALTARQANEVFSDKELVLRMCEGDSRAFEEIFFRYNGRLLAYASRYLDVPDLAKDVCQEVFLKLIERPPAILAYDTLAPWLFRVTRNLAIDKRRRRKFEVMGEDVMPETMTERTPSEHVARDSEAVLVRRLVSQLPKEIRDVVELRVFGDMAFKDIAVVLGIPQGTALWRMHHALELLREEWRKL